MKIKFMSLASGSSGNCYYIGTEGCGILVDAGIATRTIKKRLKEAGIGMETIYGVFVTHDHADHIKSVGTLGEKQHIPVYATARIHAGIDRSYCVADKLCTSARYIEKYRPLQFHDFLIEAFEVPHDGTDNVGYSIKAGERTFVFLTDLGEITPVAAGYIRRADYLVLEANYDEEMLRTGKYPFHLKERIASRTGHLSNQAAAGFLADNFTGRLKYIWLCHLSKDNNHPELAYKTVEWKLREKGVVVGKDVQLCALKRTTPSGLYEFESQEAVAGTGLLWGGAAGGGAQACHGPQPGETGGADPFK